MHMETAKSIHASQIESTVEQLERDYLLILKHLALAFNKKGLSTSHMAVFMAVERIKLGKRDPRVRLIQADVALPQKQVAACLEDLVSAGYLNTKTPKYGDADDLIYTFGAVGGKLMKAVLTR